MQTLLILSDIGVPLYSARGLTQTLTPISQAVANARTVNGAIVDLSQPQFRKYASTITCTDQRSPAIDGVWPGMEVTVHCIAELCFKQGGSPSRPAVETESGSGSESESGSASESESEEKFRTEDGFVFYRPILDMVVTGFNTDTDEYGAFVSWTLNLEEK